MLHVDRKKRDCDSGECSWLGSLHNVCIKTKKNRFGGTPCVGRLTGRSCFVDFAHELPKTIVKKVKEGAKTGTKLEDTLVTLVAENDFFPTSSCRAVIFIDHFEA